MINNIANISTITTNTTKHTAVASTGFDLESIRVGVYRGFTGFTYSRALV